jgi:hypothetical protein
MTDTLAINERPHQLARNSNDTSRTPAHSVFSTRRVEGFSCFVIHSIQELLADNHAG